MRPNADPTIRLVNQEAERLQRASDAHLREPFAGLDRDGGLVEREGINVARAELSAWRRINPRHRRWQALADFDERSGDLERQLAETQRRLAELTERQRNAPDRDAEALGQWHIAGATSARPQPETETLTNEIRIAQADRDGLERAVDAVLAEKARYVENNRDKFVKDAAKATEHARAKYLAAVDGLERAREALVDERITELWALTYPSAAAAREPQFMHALARNLTERLRRAGVSTSIDAVALSRLLREDADALATATDPEQRALIDGREPNARPTGAVWVDTPEGQQAAREDKRQRREAYEREWGQLPAW